MSRQRFGLSWLLRALAGTSYQRTLARESLRGLAVERLMTADPVTATPTMTVGALIEDCLCRHHHKIYPIVVRDRRLVGRVGIGDIGKAPRERWELTRLGEVMEAVGADDTIDPAADAVEALAKMNGTGHSRLLVARDGRLSGVLSMRDMMPFLAKRLDLEGDGRPARPPSGSRSHLRAEGRHGRSRFDKKSTLSGIDSH